MSKRAIQFLKNAAGDGQALEMRAESDAPANGCPPRHWMPKLNA
jgi:hypothetical protein